MRSPLRRGMAIRQIDEGCGRKQWRRETSGVCQATILKTAIAMWSARALSQPSCPSLQADPGRMQRAAGLPYRQGRL